MKNKPHIFGLMLLAGIFTASMAAAQEMPPPEHMGQHEPGAKDRTAMTEKIEKELGLSPEQKTQMEAIRTEFEGKQKAARTELKTKKDALKNLLDSEKPDRAKVDTLAAEINTLEGATMRTHIDHLFKVRAILTPEQFKKLEEFHKKHREEHKEWKKGGHSEETKKN